MPMSDTTKTQPGRPTFTPGSDKPPRSSRATRMASALKGTGEHRYTEGAFAMLGLALLVVDLYTLVKHPPSGLGDQIFHGAWALMALAFIPGAVVRLRALITGAGGDAAKVWKARGKDGAP
jgi:hypothetical protein